MAARTLKVMMKPIGNGQLTPLLCYEDGEELPGQCGMTIYTAADDIARVSVDFGMVEFANPELAAGACQTLQYGQVVELEEGEATPGSKV